MTITASEIELIVRRVLQTLQHDDLAAANQVPTPAAESLRSEVDTTATIHDTSEHHAPGVLELAQRVITTAGLHGKLNGMRAVRVMPGAIVTPLAVDLLRERGVTLQRMSTTRADGTVDTRTTQVSWAAEATHDRGVLHPPQVARVTWARVSLESISKQTPAVLVTPQWAKYGVQLNRCPQVQAIVADRPPVLEDALSQVRPTHLVIPASLALDTVQRLMSRFGEFQSALCRPGNGSVER